MSEVLKELQEYDLNRESRKTARLLDDVSYRRIELLLLKEILEELQAIHLLLKEEDKS